MNMTKQTVCDWLDELKTMLPGNHPWLLEGQFEQVKRFVAMGSEKETALATATIPELFGELSRRHENALFVGEAKAASGDDRQILRLHTGEVAGLGLAQMALRSIAGPKGGVWGN